MTKINTYDLFFSAVFNCCNFAFAHQTKIDALVLRAKKQNLFHVNSLNELSNQYYFIGSFKKKIKYFLFSIFFLGCTFCFSQNTKIDSLLNVLKTTKKDTTKVNVLNNLFLEYEFSDEKKAEKSLNSSLSLCKKTKYQKGLALTYINFGFFAEDKGNFSEALKNYFVALAIYKLIGNQLGVSSAYNNIGLAYYFQNNYPEALKNHLAALRIREAIGDKKNIAASYNNIGIVYGSLGNYSEELKNHNLSLKIKLAIGDKNGIAYSYDNIGGAYSEQGNYSEALKNHLLALKIREELGDKSGISNCYNNIGIIYKKQGNFSESLNNYLACMKIKAEYGDKHGIAGTYSNIGNLFLVQKKYKEANEYLVIAKKMAAQYHYKDFIKTTYLALSDLDSAIGNYKGAYDNYKMYTVYRDSIMNEENTKKTVQTQMQYEFDKQHTADSIKTSEKTIQENFKHQQEIKQQKIYTYGGIIGFGLMLVVAVVSFRAFKNKQKANILIAEQKQLVEEKQKEVMDSIRYAKRIQLALLPSEKYIERKIDELSKYK